MARISRWEQDKIISTMVSVAPVDRSGSTVAGAISDAAAGLSSLQNQVTNRNRSATDAITTQFMQNFTRGLQVHQYYKNQAEAHDNALVLKNEIAQKKLDLFMRLDDDVEAAKQASTGAPDMANSTFRKTGPELVENYIKETGAGKDVAYALREYGNSKIQSEYEKLSTWSTTQKKNNLIAGDDNLEKALENRGAKDASPDNLFKTIAAQTERLDGMDFLTPNEAKEKVDKSIGRTVFNWASKNIETKMNGKELEDWKKGFEAEDNSSVTNYLSQEQRERLKSRYDTQVTVLEHLDKEEAEKFESIVTIQIDDARSMVRNDIDDAGEAAKGKQALVEIKNGLDDQLKLGDKLSQPMRDKLVWARTKTTDEIRSIESVIATNRRAKEALETKQENEAYRDTRRERTAQNDAITDANRAAKALRSSPKAMAAEEKIIADIGVIKKFLNDGKDKKTSISMAQINSAQRQVDEAHKNKWITDSKKKEYSAQLRIQQQIRLSQGEGEQGTVAALFKLMNMKTPDVIGDAKYKSLFQSAKTYHELKFVSKYPDVKLTAEKVSALEAQAKLDAEAGIDREDQEINGR